MIKILFLIPNLGHGGAEKVLVNLVNHMNLNLFEITVMALYDEGVNRKFLSQNVKYKFFLKKSFHGIGHVLKVFPPRLLYRFIIRDSFDIVVSYLEGQTARIIGGCFDHRIKKVCWIHRTMTTKKDASRLFRNEKEAEKCYESFDYIVSVSKDVEKSFLKIFPVMRSTVLYNTNQTDLILKKAQEPIAESLFEHSEFNICGMGSLIPVKGFDRLIRVHYRLKKLGFPVHTYILGEGNEKGSLLKLIRNLKLENSVTLLGYSENPYKYLKKCDLFVCSSLSEGFSTAVTEALVLATGAAVSGNIPELVRQTKYVYELIGLEEVESGWQELLDGTVQGVWALGEDGRLVDLHLPSVFMLDKSEHDILRYGHRLFVSGAVSDRLLQYLKVRRQPVELVVRDFTRIFATPESYYAFLRKGGQIKVLHRSRLLAVTVNPVAPSGIVLDSSQLCREMENALHIPVYDVKSVG